MTCLEWFRECWTLECVEKKKEEKERTGERARLYTPTGRLLSTLDLSLAQAKRERTKPPCLPATAAWGPWGYDVGGDVSHFGCQRWIAGDVLDELENERDTTTGASDAKVKYLMDEHSEELEMLTGKQLEP